jgi:hypothetical protein
MLATIALYVMMGGRYLVTEYELRKHLNCKQKGKQNNTLNMLYEMSLTEHGKETNHCNKVLKVTLEKSIHNKRSRKH